MCDPVRTMSSIRQVVHAKFNCSNVSLHGPDDQASYMEIACTSSTVWTLAFRVRTLKALLWQLHVAEVQPFGRGLVMEAFSAILERRLHLTVRTLGQAV
jgi:hypothetical protein